jgi:hypothetical protein
MRAKIFPALSRSKAGEWLGKGFSMTRRKSFVALITAYLIWGIVFSVIMGILELVSIIAGDSDIALLIFISILPFLQVWAFVFGRNFHAGNDFYIETFLEPISGRLIALFALGGFYVLMFLCFASVTFEAGLPFWLLVLFASLGLMATHFSSALIIWRHDSMAKAIWTSLAMSLRNFYSLAAIYAVVVIDLVAVFYIMIPIKVSFPFLFVHFLNIHVFSLLIFSYYTSIMDVCGILEESVPRDKEP